MIVATLVATAIVGGPEAVLTNTDHVEALAVDEDGLWVATRGGLERYDRVTLGRTRHYTTADGLAENFVYDVDIGERVRARTRDRVCTLGEDDHFRCTPAAEPVVPALAVGHRQGGARVTARLELDGQPLVGTAGEGLWLAGSGGRKVTPSGQICTNFAAALVEHEGKLWVGGFDDGLCVTDDGESFEAVEGPRMINDMLSTPQGLYVAASEGLFRGGDGEVFERVAGVYQRGVNGVAWDGHRVLATSPGALWRVRGDSVRSQWMPGGSTALQDVALAPDGTVWLAAEDRGAIHVRGRKARVFDRAAGMPSSWAMRVAVAEDGTAYVGTLRSGVVSIAPDGSATRLTGLPDDWVLSVAAVDDALWVGTQGGAAPVVVVGGDAAPAGGRELEGLPHPNVHAFARLAGSLYVATEGGTARYAGAPGR
jgi:ligand-binding sensor domain-containing protein